MNNEFTTNSPKDAAGKSPDALRTIGEVSTELGVVQHVLRFWEDKFPQIQPVKRKGRRYYRPEDITILSRIKDLLYVEGYTIKGAQKYLAGEATAEVKPEPEDVEEPTPLTKFTTDLALSPTLQKSIANVNDYMEAIKERDAIKELKESIQASIQEEAKQEDKPAYEPYQSAIPLLKKIKLINIYDSLCEARQELEAILAE